MRLVRLPEPQAQGSVPEVREVDPVSDESEEDREIWAIISKQLEDPQVWAALGLAFVVYTRAHDVNSAINRFTDFMIRKGGGEPKSGWNAFLALFQPLIYTQFQSSELASKAKARDEITRLTKEYNKAHAKWETAMEVTSRPRPEDFMPFDIFLVTLGYKIGMEFPPEVNEHYWVNFNHVRDLQARYDHYAAIVAEGEPQIDPAVELWREVIEPSELKAIELAVIAFAIGMKPELLTESIKGIGEIIKGIGEIIPL